MRCIEHCRRTAINRPVFQFHRWRHSGYESPIEVHNHPMTSPRIRISKIIKLTSIAVENSDECRDAAAAEGCTNPEVKEYRLNCMRLKGHCRLRRSDTARQIQAKTQQELTDQTMNHGRPRRASLAGGPTQILRTRPFREEPTTAPAQCRVCVRAAG